MSLAGRLSRLEAGLTPQAVVLAWLAEAHESATLPQYVATLLDAPREAWPVVRIGTQVETAVRASVKGQPENVWEAVRQAVGEAFFLFELVLQINLQARAMLDAEGLRWDLLRQWLRALSLEAELAGGTPPGDQDHLTREAAGWRMALALSLTTLYTDEAARASLEGRYLAGRKVLFPALVPEWDDLRKRLEGLASLGHVLPEGGAKEGPELTLEELRERAAEEVPARTTELADLARVGALDLLGETERAAAIVERRLRGQEWVPPAGPQNDRGTSR